MPSIAEKTVVAIWGASGHARVVVDIVRLQGKFEIAGFIDDVNPDRKGTIFCGAAILGGKEQLSELLNRGVKQVLLAFGDCKARLDLTSFLQAEGFSLPVAIHPRAVVAAQVEMGAGTVIAAGAVVNPGVKIGRSVIINTSASVDHDCVIGDAVHICPGVHLAGRVTVGEAAQIGIGATVIDGIQIGAGTLIGAGAVVVGNIPDEVVAYGVPATIKKRVSR